tara:strand:+ start:1385 stop:1600 length:216 start_codon:yes stop_codon:yes gene_type:complete
MQLVHSLGMTALVVIGATSALFYSREKPYRDVAAASGLLCAISAAKLADREYAEQLKAVGKGLWGYLSSCQ